MADIIHIYLLAPLHIIFYVGTVKVSQLAMHKQLESSVYSWLGKV